MKLAEETIRRVTPGVLATLVVAVGWGATLNRVVWGQPNTDFSSNNVGLITSQGNSPRQMQLGLKLYW